MRRFLRRFNWHQAVRHAGWILIVVAGNEIGGTAGSLIMTAGIIMFLFQD